MWLFVRLSETGQSQSSFQVCKCENSNAKLMHTIFIRNQIPQANVLHRRAIVLTSQVVFVSDAFNKLEQFWIRHSHIQCGESDTLEKRVIPQFLWEFQPVEHCKWCRYSTPALVLFLVRIFTKGMVKINIKGVLTCFK